MAEKRVVITGLGIVSPAGAGIEENFAKLLAGQSVIKKIERFDPSGFDCQIAGEIVDFSARNYVPKGYRKAVKVMARDIEIAVAAADLAFRDADIVTRERAKEENVEMQIEPSRLGCNIGAGLICAELDELGMAAATSKNPDGKFDLKLWGEHGMTNLTPLWLLKYLPNMLSCHVTIIHGAEGPSNNITCGDASGALSVGESVTYIKRGSADAVVTGSAESKLNPMGVMRQTKLGRVCKNGNETPAAAIKPFDANHAGLAPAEGGALVILEDLDRAKSRGVRMYAEVVGFGAACDPAGMDITRPTAGNLSLAVKNAIAQAGITAGDVDMIVAYGTAVPGEDAAEAAEWKKAFGEKLASIPAVSFTGLTGTMYAGGGACQLALAAKAVEQQTVPPTINFEKPAQGCELNLSAKARKKDIKYAVVGAFTVGGQSGAVVLKKPE